MVQAHLEARLESAMVTRRRSLEWFRHILKQDWNRRWWQEGEAWNGSGTSWSKIGIGDGDKKEKLEMVQAHLEARLESAMVARRRSLEWFRHILEQDWNRRW